jgi:predicted site-specific integrase-resolvase
MTDALSTVAASRFLGLQPCTLRRWRREGRGIPYIRISGNRCVYDPEALKAYREALTVTPKRKPKGVDGE